MHFEITCNGSSAECVIPTNYLNDVPSERIVLRLCCHPNTFVLCVKYRPTYRLAQKSYTFREVVKLNGTSCVEHTETYV
jgi:hypothetical protein